jgi:ElaB/YqjD/DUF883 family membrane-anchored ribosome-binding protein
MNNEQKTDLNGPSGMGHGAMQNIAEQVTEKARDAKDAAVDFGRTTVDGIDAQRRPAAATLDRTAATLQQQADSVTGVAHAAAGRLRSTADYVRNNDMKAMGRHVGDLIRRHPGQAIAAAAMVGFFVARAMRTRA